MSKDWYKLSLDKIKSIIKYYILLFFIGFFLMLLALLYESMYCHSSIPISVVAIGGSIGSALVGSTIFYLRKIYKSSINIEMSPPQDNNDKIREFGICTYYYLRPLFAIGFSILIHISLKSSIRIVTIKEITIDTGFIYLTMFLSFFAGFAAGDLITYFEAKSSTWAIKTFKE